MTPRQLEVLRLRAEGLTRKEIAVALGLSPLTIRQYLSGAYRALGIPPNEHASGCASDSLHEAWRRLGWLRATTSAVCA